MIFIITGPSGCGKTTLVKRVLAEIKDVQFAVSHTTRKKRRSEEEGKDYYFISKAEFKQMIQEERLAEWAVVHGSYYGTSRIEIEKKGMQGDLLLDIDVQGAQQMMERYKKAIFIFVVPPSSKELERRLKKRGDESPDSIKGRLESAQKEIRCYHQFGYIVINDELDHAALELKSIILSTRSRFESRKKELVPILRGFSEDL
ncbi:MAG: guanylate kinase [Candidatus Aminicenantes bacterium]|nr:MAG: guanylate kinase [Candidatus Aminicenantes bacterium]